MSEKNIFIGGFLLGTLVGGVVGGVMGTLIAKGSNDKPENDESNSLFPSRKQSGLDGDDNMEEARLNLESKIHQLNSAIDDVRLTLLHNVNAPEKELETED
jgi:hypothetical protein